MPLNSYEFVLAFLPVVFSGYCLIQRYGSRRTALGWLLLASVGFYAAGGIGSALLIAVSIAWCYIAAKLFIAIPIERVRARRFIIYTAITTDILFLCYFKYLSFAVHAVNAIIATHLAASSAFLPLGLSFLTFQKIAFLTDLRSGTVKSVQLLDFALFSSFFPRAIAGPIVRYNDFTTQLHRSYPQVQYSDLMVGFCLLAVGLFKETVIASIAEQFVTPIFEPFLPHAPIALMDAWTGALAYTFQLYFEFSGYSDMALGTARLFGIRLPMNFNSPLKATSLVDFWGRWHITLTRFLTWQIYIPLVRWLTRIRLDAGRTGLQGANSTLPAILTLIGIPTFVTMTVSGLWHGSGWHYILWGATHGACLTVNQCWRLWRSRKFSYDESYKRVMTPIGRALTLLVIICTLVIFRADDVPGAVAIFKGMIGLNGIVFPEYAKLLVEQGPHSSWGYITLYSYWYPCMCLGLMLVITMTMPNSLELLRGFGPALDFSSPDNSVPLAITEKLGHGHRNSHRTLLVSSLDLMVAITTHGIRLSRRTAFLYAILLVLGVEAIVRSGAFIYGKF